MCRADGESKYDDEIEQEKLEEKFGPSAAATFAGRLGVGTLKDRLPALFEKLVRCNLPALRKQANEKLKSAERSIARLGDKPLSQVRCCTSSPHTPRNQTAMRATRL